MAALRVVRFERLYYNMSVVYRASRVFVFVEVVDASRVLESTDQIVFVIRVGENV